MLQYFVNDNIKTDKLMNFETFNQFPALEQVKGVFGTSLNINDATSC